MSDPNTSAPEATPTPDTELANAAILLRIPENFDLLAARLPGTAIVRHQLDEALRYVIAWANGVQFKPRPVMGLTAPVKDGEQTHWQAMLARLRSQDAIPNRSEVADAFETVINVITKERDDALEAVKDAESVTRAWFDTKALAQEDIGPAMLDAAKGYLRVCRSGGMTQKRSDKVLAAVGGMIDLGYLLAPVVRYIRTFQPAKVEELEAQVYVPGQWCCDTCLFTLQKSVISAIDGSIGDSDKPGGECPNCHRLLKRMTWQQLFAEQSERGVEQVERALDAENALAALKAGFATAEPSAVAYDHDGHGFRYIDEGSGSDWYARGIAHEGHVVLYAIEDLLPDSEAYLKAETDAADKDRYHRAANILAEFAGDVSDMVLGIGDDAPEPLRALCEKYAEGGVRAFMPAPETQGEAQEATPKPE